MSDFSAQKVDVSLRAMRELFREAFEDFCSSDIANIRAGVPERNL